jgi:hypothetical protein
VLHRNWPSYTGTQAAVNFCLLTCSTQLPSLTFYKDTETIKDVFAFAGPAPEVSVNVEITTD